jgi:hypothetical protein
LHRGYPTFTLWGRLFIDILPWGTPAWRVGMSVAVMNAGAAAGAYLCVRLLTHSRGAAVAAAFGFLCSPTVWTYASQGEVFGLNNALHAALCVATALFGASRATSMAALNGTYRFTCPHLHT